MIGWRQHDQAVTAVFLVDADDIEQVQREVNQVGVVILFADSIRQRLRCFAAVGVQLQ